MTALPLMAREVPSVTTLCRDLGCGQERTGLTKRKLTVSTSTWRRTYVSKEGTPGKHIRYWKPEDGNYDLVMMASEFLKAGYGLQHWDPSSGGSLQYPRDTGRLIELLYQLLFRQNENAYHNRHLVGGPPQYTSDELSHQGSDSEVSLSTPTSDYSDESDSHDGDKKQRSSNIQRNKIKSGHGRRQSQRIAKKSPVSEEADSEADVKDESSLIFRRKFLLRQFQEAFKEAFSFDRIKQGPQIAHMTRKDDKLIASSYGTPKNPINLTEEDSVDYHRDTADLKKVFRRRNVSGPARMLAKDDMTNLAPIKDLAPESYNHEHEVPDKEGRGANVGLQEGRPHTNEDDEDSDEPIIRRASHHKRTSSRLSPPSKGTSRYTKSQRRALHSTEYSIWPASPMNGSISESLYACPSSTNMGAKAVADTGSEKHAEKKPKNRDQTGVNGAVAQTFSLYDRACKNCYFYHSKCDKIQPCTRCKLCGYDCTCDFNSNVESRPVPQQSHCRTAQQILRSIETPEIKGIEAPNRLENERSVGSAPILPKAEPYALQTSRRDTATRESPSRSQPSRGPILDHLSHHDVSQARPSQPINSSRLHADTPITPLSPHSVTQPVKASQPSSTPKPPSQAYEIRYFILITTNSRTIRHRWSGGKLGESSLSDFFKETASYTHEATITELQFNLSFADTDIPEIEYTVCRDDEEMFGEMKEEFLDGLREARRRGVNKSKILLQPILIGQERNDRKWKEERDAEGSKMMIW